MQMSQAPADFDALAPETFESAHQTYADLRARCPVAHSDAYGGFWALARYRDVVDVLNAPGRFITSRQNVVPGVAFTGRRPPLHFDPPEHTPYRAVLNPLLSQEAVAKLEPAIRAYAREYLQPLLLRGDCEICADYGSTVPVRAFAHWMRLPPDLEAELSVRGPAFVRAVESGQADAMRTTSLALYEIARDMVALRGREPADPAVDPTAAMLAGRTIGDEPFPRELVIGMVRQVLVVGIVAPTVMMGSIAVHLSRHPELHDQLRDHPELIPAALEEFLRLYTPYRGFARTANADVEIGGRKIREGEPIALLYASANRDEQVFEDPDEFILHRPNIKEHIAFGRGAHYCAGAALGRLELRVMLEELVLGTRRIDVTGPLLMSPFPEMGPWSVPVRLHPVGPQQTAAGDQGPTAQA